MRRALIVAVAVALFGTVREAMAWLPRGSSTNPTPGVVPGAAGRSSFAGVPGLGAPLPASPTRPGTNPVVGSVSRTGHFVHPLTGRTRYSGTAYNPTLGRFSSFHFRQ